MSARANRPAPAAVELAGRIHSAAIHLLRRLRRVDDATGLPAPQLSALSVIAHAGPITLGALATAEQVRPPTMTKVVGALEEAGLVRRTVHPSDRRVTTVSVTAAGRRLFEAGRGRRVDTLAAGIEGLSREDRDALTRAALVMERLAGRPGLT
jgi:DNA-binding MarR family transcriptional regulator